MEFGKHIGKGLWAFGDKALPAIYGVGFIFFVARVLPSEEYGLFVIVQSIFNVISATIFTVALQPLIKYVSEYEDATAYIISSIYVQVSIIVICSGIILIFSSTIASLLDDDHRVQLADLFLYLPVMLGASFVRNFSVSILQTSFNIKKIFWIDSVSFVGMLLGYGIAHLAGYLQSAVDVIAINILMYSLSSMIGLSVARKSITWKLRFYRAELKEMFRFGRFMFGGSVSYTLFSQFDVFFVSYFSGAVAVAGYYNAKVFVRIFDMVGQVLQMLLVPFASRAFARKEYSKLTVVGEKAICFSTIVLLPVSALMILFPEMIMNALYGGKYNDAMNIVRVLGFLLIVYPMNAVSSNYLIGIGRAKEGFYFGLALTLVAIPLYYFLGALLGSVGVALAFVLSIAVSGIAVTTYLMFFTPIKFSGISTIARVFDVLEFIKSRSLLKQE